MTESADVAITTVLSFLVIVDIVGNSVVCVIIKKYRDMRTPINYLLVNLVVADILFGMFIAPKVLFKLIFTHTGGVTGTFLCKSLIRGNVALIGGHSSMMTLVVIAIERYYAVLYPFGNKWKLSKRHLKVIFPGIWVFALILNIPLFLVVDTLKVKSSNFCGYVWPEAWMGKAYSWTLLVFQTLIPLPLMIGLYSRVVYTLWFKRNDHSQVKNQQMGIIRIRKRATLMAIVVSAIFGICWGAESVEYVLRNLPSLNISPFVIAIVDIMVLFNSAANPFVYALLNQQFREKMKRMIFCTGSSAHRVDATLAQKTKLADNTIHPTHTDKVPLNGVFIQVSGKTHPLEFT